MKITHIYLDMDGVLCDWVGAALRVHNRMEVLDAWPQGEWDIAKVLGMEPEDFWRRIDHRSEGFWATLSPYPWMRRLVELLESLAAPITIASAPSDDPFSAAGKLIWINKHLPQFAQRYQLGLEKHLLARPDTLLIDDNERTVEDFLAAGGLAMLFPQPWNSNHHVKFKMAFVKGYLETVLSWSE
jgi:5'(3')-deoxyribonucleotidase